MTSLTDELHGIYRQTLERVAPARLVRRALAADDATRHARGPVRVVAMGKCAAGMLAGAAAALPIRRALVAMPRGYCETSFPAWATIVRGSHPDMTDASFDAGDALLEFVGSGEEPLVVLVSGGSSACVDAPLTPFFERDDLTELNQRLLAAGLPIGAMNVPRRHVSAIKGGRLGRRLPPGSIAIVLSDVARGRPGDAGSGPTFADESTNLDAAGIVESLGGARCARIAERLRSGTVPETEKTETTRHMLAGDNGTLVREASSVARSRGWRVTEVPAELDGTVEDAAEILARKAAMLAPGDLVIAGGEPTVEVHGGGRGGRASEVAVRFLRRIRPDDDALAALFATTDGVDGSSAAAGWIIGPGTKRPDPASVERAIAESDTASLAEGFADRIEEQPTGNNLRDIFMVARVRAGERSNG